MKRAGECRLILRPDDRELSVSEVVCHVVCHARRIAGSTGRRFENRTAKPAIRQGPRWMSKVSAGYHRCHAVGGTAGNGEVLAAIDTCAVDRGESPGNRAGIQEVELFSEGGNKSVDQAKIQGTVDSCRIGDIQLIVLRSGGGSSDGDVQSAAGVLLIRSGYCQNAGFGRRIRWCQRARITYAEPQCPRSEKGSGIQVESRRGGRGLERAVHRSGASGLGISTGAVHGEGASLVHVDGT